MPRPVTPLGLLTAELDDLARRVGALGSADPELAAGLRRARELAGGLDPYVAASTSPESPALAALHRRTRAEDWGAVPGDLGLEEEMLSGHVEGQFLKLLVGAVRATRVLEIGLFTGYSALAMAEALPADGVLVACELDPHAAAVAADCLAASPDGAKVRIEVAPAAETLGALAAAGEAFDLVFIDADKAGYEEYLRRVLDDGLLADGGVVCVDNTLLQGRPYLAGGREPASDAAAGEGAASDAAAPADAGRPADPAAANGAAIAAFNLAVARDPRVQQVLLPLRDGLTLIRRVA